MGVQRKGYTVPVSCCNGTGEGGAATPSDIPKCQDAAQRHVSPSPYYYHDVSSVTIVVAGSA
jgi:hypothetical protein